MEWSIQVFFCSIGKYQEVLRMLNSINYIKATYDSKDLFITKHICLGSFTHLVPMFSPDYLEPGRDLDIYHIHSFLY